MLTLGLEKDRSTPSSSSRLSRVAALIALPLSAWRIKGWRRPLLIRSVAGEQDSLALLVAKTV